MDTDLEDLGGVFLSVIWHSVSVSRARWPRHRGRSCTGTTTSWWPDTMELCSRGCPLFILHINPTVLWGFGMIIQHPGGVADVSNQILLRISRAPLECSYFGGLAVNFYIDRTTSTLSLRSTPVVPVWTGRSIRLAHGRTPRSSLGSAERQDGALWPRQSLRLNPSWQSFSG